MAVLNRSNVVGYFVPASAVGKLEFSACETDEVMAVVDTLDNKALAVNEYLYDLAACYACYSAIGHCFHDANKRTAHTAMQAILKLNDIQLDYEVKLLGDMIINAAGGRVDETEFAAYLRSLQATY